MLSITSICISRIMLGIRSLAAELISDPTLLLNNAELSRVLLKKGTNAGEFIVNVDHEDVTKYGVLDIRRQSGSAADVGSDMDRSSADTVLQIGPPV
jgi:hypothetical protein